MKELVLKIDYGGLGDHLLWTPIPRVAKQVHGYDKVYISNLSAYRNPHTKDFIWGRNPYIDGFVDDDAPTPNFSTVPKGKNILDAMVDFVGLPDDGQRFREPEVYYFPRTIPELSGFDVFDPNSINRSGVPSLDLVEKYFQSIGLSNLTTLQFESLYGWVPVGPRKEIVANGLVGLCDIIISCRRLICFTTGIATLAAALGKQAWVLYVPGIKPMFHHSKRHQYIDIGKLNIC